MVVGAAFFAVLMFGWLLWFFFAGIPSYASSTTATYVQEGYIVATFGEDAFPQLRRGQSAQFHLPAAGKSLPVVALTVTDLYPETGEVRLILRDDSGAMLLQPGMGGQVKVVTEEVSPARTVLRAAGLLPEL